MKYSQSLPIVVCGIALLAVAATLNTEPLRKPRPPEVTSTEVLARLDALGAKYKLNRHDQVDWLWIKRLPLSDDDLQVLVELPHVKTLNMRGIQTMKGNTLTDAGLKHLVNLKQLETLNLSANSQLTDECAKWLGTLTSLRVLNLTQTEITEAALPDLSKLQHLETLHCNGMRLSEDTVSFFSNMSLKELWGIRISADDRCLLPQLRHLETWPADPIDPSRQLRDIDLIHYRHIKQIDHLSVSLTKGWSDTSQLRYLQEFSHLKRLQLGSIHEPTEDFDAEGIESLAEVPALRVVLPGRINDEVLAAFSHCPQITILDLTSPVNQISAKGLRSLQRMPNLKALSIPRKVVSDETIEAISHITSLEMLALDGHDLYPNVSGRDYWTPIPRTFSLESLEFLNELPNLKILYVDFWGLGDEALEYLSRLENLQSLSIRDKADQGSGIPISEPALLKLRHLPNLKSLDFQGTATSIQAAERLHEFLPDCYITDNWCCGCLSIGPLQSIYELNDSLNLDR